MDAVKSIVASTAGLLEDELPAAGSGTATPLRAASMRAASRSAAHFFATMARQLKIQLTRPSWSALRSALPWVVLIASIGCTLVAWLLLDADSRGKVLRPSWDMPVVALSGGLTLSALLFLIAWYSASTAQRAEELARGITAAHARLQARLQGVFATAMDAIITVDEHQKITMFNAAAEGIFGYRADQVLGQPIDMLIPSPHRRRHREHMRLFGETGSTARTMGPAFNVRGVRASGEEFPIDASISRLREGPHLIYTVILRDITLRQEAEDALNRAQSELQLSHEQLRQLSVHAETTREAERIRIAREIHDELAATLTGVKMDLSAARDAIHQDPDHTEKRLRASLELMDNAVLTTRRIINDLRPSILDNLGVWAAIEWLAEETARRARIECRAIVDPNLENLDLSAALSTAIFRIVQEALNNVWRHAGAHSAHVFCARRKDAIEIEVRDDGRGIDDPSMTKPGHWGLLGMGERVRAHGGILRIDSQPDQGTRILARFPLPSATAAHTP